MLRLLICDRALPWIQIREQFGMRVDTRHEETSSRRNQEIPFCCRETSFLPAETSYNSIRETCRSAISVSSLRMVIMCCCGFCERLQLLFRNCHGS
ncbi:hypothetical protein PISMIDRAFT_229965 [Pisolithus microcarpus 441]|uniref:Uncharacterized protein n=1 Tax=Pisolithus microcarpus 441 TaxID=765257 RepID=A0A0C9XXQ7_9AGAM|nr:hypothetical protein PISMIDRAFT_229965 [Pisolithus microcarpus 441]